MLREKRDDDDDGKAVDGRGRQDDRKKELNKSDGKEFNIPH